MPYDSGFQNPDGSITFGGSSGSLTTAPTPFALDYLSTLKKRQEESAPLAMGGPPDLMGIVNQQAKAPPVQVADFRPSLEQAKADPLGAIVASGAPQLSSGVPLPGREPGTTVAPPQALPKGVTAPGAKVDPSQLRFAGGGPAGAPQQGPMGAPVASDTAADLHMKAAMYELQHPGGGARGPAPGKYQTGEGIKAVDARVGPEAEKQMLDADTAQRLAGSAADQAQAKHAADVEGRMGFARFLEQGKDSLLAERKQEAMRSLNEQRVTLDKDIAETKIDPQGFWADKTTGDKIAFVLSSAITGYLNGRAGIAGNQVLAAVNKRIDENIAAQVRNLDTKKGRMGELGRIYQQTKEQYGDEDIARGVARSAALAAAAKTAQAQASATGNEAAMANAAKLVADIDAARAKIHYENEGKLSKTVDQNFKVVSPGANGSGGGGNPFEKAALLFDKAGASQADAKKLAAAQDPTKGPQRVVVNGTTYDMPNMGQEEAGRTRTKLSVLGTARERLNKIEQAQQGSYLERSAYTASGRQKDLVGDLVDALSIGKDQGMVKEPEIQRKLEGILSLRSGKETIQDTRALIDRIEVEALRQGGAVPVKGK